MTRAHWWALAGLAAVVIVMVYLQHQRCGNCQRRGRMMLRQLGNLLMGLGQKLVGAGGS